MELSHPIDEVAAGIHGELTVESTLDPVQTAIDLLSSFVRIHELTSDPNRSSWPHGQLRKQHGIILLKVLNG